MVLIQDGLESHVCVLAQKSYRRANGFVRAAVTLQMPNNVTGTDNAISAFTTRYRGVC
jgi:hypothetical protein